MIIDANNFTQDFCGAGICAKMKAIISLVVATAAIIPIVLSYDEKYDKVDVDKLIADYSVFEGYINCWLDKGPCNQEYAEDYKAILPELVSTSCDKCTPLQKQSVRKVGKAFFERKPSLVEEFWKKYDPNGEYKAAYEAFVTADSDSCK